MGIEKQLLTAAIAAGYLAVAGAAFAVQPVNKPVLKGNSCGNNGNGNGGEETSLGVTPPPPALCFKFVPEDVDQPGTPGDSCVNEIDPTCKPSL
jgi:hypothetical protein